MVQVPFYILRTYRYKGYYIDICCDTDYEAWIYNRHYATKLLVSTFCVDVCSLDEFVKVVEENIDQYIEDYYDFIRGR